MQNCCFKPLLSWDNSCFILFQNVCFCIWKSGNSYFPVPPLQVSPMLGTATLLSFDRANDCVKPAYKILQGNVLRNYNFPCIYICIYIYYNLPVHASFQPQPHSTILCFAVSPSFNKISFKPLSFVRYFMF